MSEIKLKPCPFCGYDKPFLMFCEYDQLKWTISCPKCSIEVTTPVLRDLVGNIRNGKRRSNKTNLIEKWNKRAEKTGKWIIKKDRFNSTCAVCSECGVKNCAGNFKYCFECGVKMEEYE